MKRSFVDGENRCFFFVGGYCRRISLQVIYCMNSFLGFFLAHKLTCGKRESVSQQNTR